MRWAAAAVLSAAPAESPMPATDARVCRADSDTPWYSFCNPPNFSRASAARAFTPACHDPALVRARIDDTSVSEPVNGTVNAVFTVTMGADTSVRTFQYTTEDGTATAGSDYATTSGTLTFQPGQTTKTISVPVKADIALEDDEYFQVVLSETEEGLQIERGIAIGAVLNTGGAPILFADGFD